MGEDHLWMRSLHTTAAPCSSLPMDCIATSVKHQGENENNDSDGKKAQPLINGNVLEMTADEEGTNPRHINNSNNKIDVIVFANFEDNNMKKPAREIAGEYSKRQFPDYTHVVHECNNITELQEAFNLSMGCEICVLVLSHGVVVKKEVPPRLLLARGYGDGDGCGTVDPDDKLWMSPQALVNAADKRGFHEITLVLGTCNGEETIMGVTADWLKAADEGNKSIWVNHHFFGTVSDVPELTYIGHLYGFSVGNVTPATIFKSILLCSQWPLKNGKNPFDQVTPEEHIGLFFLGLASSESGFLSGSDRYRAENRALVQRAKDFQKRILEAASTASKLDFYVPRHCKEQVQLKDCQIMLYTSSFNGAAALKHLEEHPDDVDKMCERLRALEQSAREAEDALVKIRTCISAIKK